jgi:putative endonuclease
MLSCEHDRLYIGSTRNLIKRFQLHLEGYGANFTKKHPPIEVVYLEFYSDVRYAYHREKQLQKWSRSKKEALIVKNLNELQLLAECQNDSHYMNKIDPSLDSARDSIIDKLLNLERSRKVKGNLESRGEGSLSI